MMRLVRSVEFRVPISPTRAFFHQIRFFDYGLRRLGGLYEEAKVLVMVGDHADIRDVVQQNQWSRARNIEWRAVPSNLFDKYGIHGTADSRYLPESTADLVILSDADTVLNRDIDPLLESFDPDAAIVAGHMAHYPPPVPDGAPDTSDKDMIWEKLLPALGLTMPASLYPYSMDIERRFKPGPAYFNLGFVALTQSALAMFRERIWPVQDWLLQNHPTHMRCQIAVTLMALSSDAVLRALDASYNLANDERHLIANRIAAAEARVIHYLRTEELDRNLISLPESLPRVLATHCTNPVNRVLQRLLAGYAHAEFGLC